MFFLTLLFLREEEKSVKQVLSDMLTCPVTWLKEGILLLTRSLRTRAKALVTVAAGLSSFGIAISYLAQEHPVAAALSSLLSGFAPVIGFCLLLIIVALLISLLICTVERTFCSDDDNAVPETGKKHRWCIAGSCSSDLFTNYLSLKEHSPPAVLSC